MIRTVLAFLLAVAIYFALTWLPTGFLGNLFMSMHAPDSVVGASRTAIDVARDLAPGFFVGLFVSARPALLGGLASGLAAVIALVWVFSTSSLFFEPAEAVGSFVEQFFYGAVAGAAGAFMRAGLRANNSFKPKPLRGSA